MPNNYAGSSNVVSLEGNQEYKCVRCGAPNSGDDLAVRGGDAKCVMCGYKVLIKTRPPTVKRVKAV